MPHSLASVLGDRRVVCLQGGYQFVLELSDGLAVTISSDFRLTTGEAVTGIAGVEHFFPGLAMEPSGGLLKLPGARISEAGTTLAGGLHLSFDCGLALDVPPDTADQPWVVTGPTGPLFTALPGGYLTT
ncbi:DUF6188 family protein [Kitasatospora sp. MAP5-34]|uniref:DUF6188 family protein n=1 Tax=Kitasatospora sp. MAP5-34 TaxID=3035102 RepID=UPI00247397F8|nr:DUF6188 family protein [Kitasatospora sp. MAP5-34]MDH6579278.1 hypothetical protein [Kitasatospora sp. MAP5-34]